MSVEHFIPLGPFELRKPIGKGGMAEVWEGRHARQDVPIALKVITSEKARKGQLQAAFGNEVRAVAGLDHPGIVMVFDHGLVTEEAEQLSHGRLVAGSPYLAMELATGGSLFQVRKTFAWRELRQVLRAVLDALSHAHARGVIHRDLKPANVLRATAADVRPGIKLTDFGLAHALDPRHGTPEEGEVSGTAQYMAPEQFEGRWRDFGPWTDLYALGCMAWELACGQRPFDGEDFWEIFYAHRDGAPKMKPVTPVPRDFESWVLRLMAPRTQMRFQRAADAAWALLNLEEPDPMTVALAAPHTTLHPAGLGAAALVKGLTPSIFDGDTRGYESGRGADVLPSDILFGFEDEDEDEPLSVEMPAPMVDTTPSLPRGWSAPEVQSTSMQLVGAGLGLYGLRAVPMVGRKEERDLLWGALRSVASAGEARCVILEGPAGSGKSRLIEWLCERAHELGGATALKAAHNPVDGQADGLARMVAQHLRCLGLARHETLARCRRLLEARQIDDEYEWLALTELMHPSTEPPRPGERAVRFSSPNQRYVLMRRLIEREANRRPVILWIDDAQWGSDAIAFAHYLLKVQPHAPSPTLIVLSAEQESLSRRALEATQLRDLAAHERAIRIHVPALEEADHRRLVQHLLGLEGHLADEVADRTAGNPMFAIQLVGDWVQRGVLEVGHTGFVLSPGEQAIIPDDIHQLWSHRIERFLADRPASSRLSLELAAALGQTVDRPEWRAAAERAGVTLDEDLHGALIKVGLAHQGQEQDWSFAHNMLRESVARACSEAGRWAPHNLACAEALRALNPGDHRLIAHRLGNHLLEGGNIEQALGPLLDGAAVKIAGSDHRLARRLIDRRHQALDQLGAPAEDLRRAQGELLKAQCSLEEGRVDDSAAIADAVGQLAHRHGWARLMPEALRLLGHVHRKNSQLRPARACFTRALTLFEDNNDRLGVGSCLRGLGEVARQQDRLREAQKLLLRAQAVFESIDDRLGAANCLHGLGIVARKRHRDDLAIELTRTAQRTFEAIGYSQGAINCLNSVAEIARHAGDIDAARAGYQRAIALAEATGASSSVLPRLNLALVLIEDQRFEQAELMLIEARTELRSTGGRGLLVAVEAVLLPCLAHRKDWGAFDHHLAEALDLLASTGMNDPDIARPTQLAGTIARDAGQHIRARQALNIALQQWTSLNDTPKADLTRALLAALPQP